MNIYRVKKIEDVPILNDSSLILGLFDGVHIGHKSLIELALNYKNYPVSILTFNKSINKDNLYLTSLKDRINYFKNLGVANLIIIYVSNKLIKTSPSDFLNFYIKKIKPIYIFCGEDFRFGYKGEGDINYLKKMFTNVKIVPFFKDRNNQKISTSLIKNLIKEGKVDEVKNYLNRYYSLKGKVVNGKKIGRNISFPTANLKLSFNYLIPLSGVYITLTKYQNKLFKSITNIGYNETISINNNLTIETNIFDFNKEIYGKYIEIFFIKKIRDDKKFIDLESLKEAIKLDKEIVLNYFKKSS